MREKSNNGEAMTKSQSILHPEHQSPDERDIPYHRLTPSYRNFNLFLPAKPATSLGLIINSPEL